MVQKIIIKKEEYAWFGDLEVVSVAEAFKFIAVGTSTTVSL